MNIETDGLKIKRLAEERGVSLEDLLANIGMPPQRYRLLAAGQVLIRKEVLRVCRHLGIPEVLVTEQGPPATVESYKRAARILGEMELSREQARAIFDRLGPRIEQSMTFRGAKVLDESTILQMMEGEDFSDEPSGNGDES